MRNRMMIMAVVGIMLVLVGCSLFYNEYDLVRYKAPNWTDNGKIVFIKDYRHVRDKKTITGLIGDVAGSWEAYILCEIDKDGNNYTEICTLAVCKESAYLLRIDNTSSSGEWVSMGMVGGYGIEKGVYVVKRDGSGLMRVSEGTYPDLSPNADKIVYQKENEGIWIMNRDGSGDHQIVSDTTASYPAWSPDGEYISCVKGSYKLYIHKKGGELARYIDIINELNNNDSLRFNVGEGHSWCTTDSNSIYITVYFIKNWIRKISLIKFNSNNDSLEISYRNSDAGYIKVYNNELIGYDSNWLVSDLDGNNKWYIEP